MQIEAGNVFMNAFEKLSRDNSFYLNVWEDRKNGSLRKEGLTPELEAVDDMEPTEYRFYVERVGFMLSHTISWCNQLDLSVKLLSNFSYSKKASYSRAHHLILNIENYLIRLQSVYDRVLQLVNVTFHLCIDEEHVNHRVIISNLKVKHRPNVQKAIQRIRKHLKDYAQARHTLIHKHSYQEERLSNIELLYMGTPSMFDDSEYFPRLEKFRKNRLREYLGDKKQEFATINAELARLMFDLFNLLSEEYSRQKTSLE